MLNNGSDLFKESLTVLNVDSLRDLTYADRVKLLVRHPINSVYQW